MNFRVLVTSSGSATAQSVIKGLRLQTEFNCEIWAADMSRQNAGAYLADRFSPVPPAHDPGYSNALAGLCRREAIALLVPIHDDELLAVSRHKEIFLAAGCRPVVSGEEAIRICHDKQKTYEFFKEIGISSPAVYRVEDALSGKGGVPYPVFGKPQSGLASAGTAVLKTESQLRDWVKTVDRPLIQAYVRGVEYSVDVLADFGGRIIEAVVRTREQTRHGASVRGVTLKDREIMNDAIAIARKLRIVGPCNIQCIRDSSGKLYFLEVNPRFSAAHIHTIAAGLNSPHLLLRMLDGQEVRPRIGQFTEGLRMFRYWDEIFVGPDAETALT